MAGKNTTVTYRTENATAKPYSKKNKYQVNNIPFSTQLYASNQPGPQGTSVTPNDGFLHCMQQIIPSTTVAGKRKAGKFTISLSLEGKKDSIIYWALVYVTDQVDMPNWVTPTGEQLYKPSSAVLASGMNDTNAGPVRIYSPLFKNLNSADRIFLIMSVAPAVGDGMTEDEEVTAGTTVKGLVRYAICYN